MKYAILHPAALLLPLALLTGCARTPDMTPVWQETLPGSGAKATLSNCTLQDEREVDYIYSREDQDWKTRPALFTTASPVLTLTGVTAEKHDSFIGNFDSQGKVLMDLSGKELIKGETDGSSFPSGGLRETCSARGYTAWDCTSPAFLREDACGVTLCIPTAFCSYTGEALDQKTPLLRSMQAIDVQSLRILRLFGNTTAKRVCPSVGPEQEYFIVDRQKYLQRKDLIYTGRTLFGAMPPKGQELDDHYFGAIRERIGAYMKAVNEELWKLGVTSKTQHNEVAPAQHELAPIYDQANLAVDHNQMVMETLKKVAGRQGLTCLLHEKPFAGVNGSGKHNNWSLTSDDGVNLLNPGDTPHENIQFLLVLACILKAVDIHADLLRESAADIGNDHRLGANEAPPAIISVFLGEQLEDVIDQLCSTGEATHSKSGGTLRTGVATLPDLDKDATDRNRTSPFAFTGNKFEFRMVGSSDSVAPANVVLNTIVAEAFKEAADELEKADDFDTAVHDMIKKLLRDHKHIIFNGNGYSDEWPVEAEKRGLLNLKSTPEAVPTFLAQKNVDVFSKYGVYTEAELQSRVEILLDEYCKTLNIEALTMIDMAKKEILPAAAKYIKDIAKTAELAKSCGAETVFEEETVKEISALVTEMYKALGTLEADVQKVHSIEDTQEMANYFHDTIFADMGALRVPADKIETLVGKDYWPYPTYSDLLFYVK